MYIYTYNFAMFNAVFFTGVLHHREISFELQNRINFARSQPEDKRKYKNLLVSEKINKHFSREIIFRAG